MEKEERDYKTVLNFAHDDPDFAPAVRASFIRFKAESDVFLIGLNQELAHLEANTCRLRAQSPYSTSRGGRASSNHGASS